MTKLDIQAKEWLKIGLKGNYLGAKEWGVPARIQNATWMTPYSYTHARQPGYENWPNSRPDGNSASPFGDLVLVTLICGQMIRSVIITSMVLRMHR